MKLDKVIEGVECHYHMVCHKCPYHRAADSENEEYCGRGELFRDVIEMLDIIKKMYAVMESRRRTDESVDCL